MNSTFARQLVWLLLIAGVVLLAGLGLRDPWPADEPRFALIARDMADSGQWLLPRVGGVLYPDKPPLFFWLVASVYAVTGSLQVAFLLPAALAGLAILFLVADVGRRLWGPKTGIWCGAALLALAQFPLQMKSGQIDGALCLMTTASLYGLLRHLLLGPDWRWYTAGGLFAGLGVITKGVGFLPLLVLIPYAFALRGAWPVYRHGWRDVRWLLAPAAFTLPILAWLVPMLVATSAGGELEAYRDNILFHQTVTRYASPWGHIKPAWYLFTNAVPWLWFPGSFLLPWLFPAWRRDLRDRDAGVLLLGAWVLFVLLFFSFSAGKRSVYILPAAPAFALLVGYHAESLFRRVGVQRLFVVLPAILGAAMTGAALYALANPHALSDWLPDVAVVFRAAVALLVTGCLMLSIVALCRRRRVLAGYTGTMLVFWLGLSVLVAPVIDSTRSGAALIAAVSERVPAGQALGFVAWPEQFLLQWDGPAYHFGFRRNPEDDLRDAASWLAASGNRRVLLPAHLQGPCFDRTRATPVGKAHRRDWLLVDRRAVTDPCLSGVSAPELVVHYVPPGQPRIAYAAAPATVDGTAAGRAVLGRQAPATKDGRRGEPQD